MIGSYSCPIDSNTHSENYLMCTVGLNSSLVPSRVYQINVLVKNIGYAIAQKWISFKFTPKIFAIEPYIGNFLQFIKQKSIKSTYKFLLKVLSGAVPL